MSPQIRCMFCLLLSVSLSEADYSFTIRFFEFRNPLGLQCDECGNGGPPACCDDVQRLENCNTTRPFECDTRFRFLLRLFGEPVETARNTGFPYFTPSNSLVNSFTFNEGPSGLLALPNPFTITRTETWTGRKQFFIDAIDRDVPMSTSGISETQAIINRFPIDLELNPGPDFTERTTYTGIYDISDVGFDMSFRVQCLENYFGPNCTTFCEPLEEVYTCDSEGSFVCLHNRDPTTNCTSCLPNYDPEQKCTQCLLGRTLSTNCTQCVVGRDITTNCTTCLSGYDILTNCTTCLFGCKATSVEFQTCPSQSSIETESASSQDQVVPAAVGCVLAVSVIMNIILVIIVVVMYIRGRGSCSRVHSPQSCKVNEEDNKDIEMKPNTVYGVTSEGIVTQPNEVYGVTNTPSEPNTLTDAYEYVNP